MHKLTKSDLVGSQVDCSKVAQLLVHATVIVGAKSFWGPELYFKDHCRPKYNLISSLMNLLMRQHVLADGRVVGRPSDYTAIQKYHPQQDRKMVRLRSHAG